MKIWFAVTGGWIYRRRWPVFLVSFFLLILVVYAGRNVRFDNSFNAYFDEDDPAYTGFLAFRDEFGSDETSYILYTAPAAEYGVWDMEIMKKINRLTRQLEESVPFVKDVVSLANAEFVEGVSGELLVHDMLEDVPETQQAMLNLKKRILNKPLYINGLVSKDGRYGAIILEMEKASIDTIDEIRYDPEKGDHMNNLYPQITYDRIQAILEKPEYAGIRFYHTGDVPLNASYNRISQSESQRLAIIAFLVIGLMLLFFFRNAMGVIGPLLIVFCSIIGVVGFVGIMSWDFDLMFIMLPALLVAVGVADAVHLLSEYDHYLVQEQDRQKALQQTLFLVGVPCLFTSLTTMAGFASMSVSPIKAIKHFAIYSSVGVGMAFLLTITLLGALLSFGRKRPAIKKRDARDENKAALMKRVMTRVSRTNIRHRRSILLFFALLMLFTGAGLFRLQVDSNFLSEFSTRSEIRRVTEFVDRIMGGSTGFSYVFDSGQTDGVTNPDFLRQIEAMQNEAEQKDVVMKAYSIVDLLKDINRAFHNGDPAYYRIPDNRETAAQLLLVYEMSGGDALSDYLSGDFRKARLELRCQAVASSRYKKLVDELDAYLRSRTAGDRFPEPTLSGMGTLWLKLLDYITSSQIQGFSIAFGVIAVMMCIVLGSWRVGLLSMVPNLAPIVITLGLMGWLGIELDYVKLLIGCIAIGLAVDDTVHMVVRFQHEFHVRRNYHQALTAAFCGVGRALFITSVVLVAGFLVNVFSIMQTLVDFGLLVAFTILTALLADYFLLPALVLTFRPFGPETATDHNG